MLTLQQWTSEHSKTATNEIYIQDYSIVKHNTINETTLKNTANINTVK